MRRRIAVCDDDKRILRQLSQYLDQIQRETGDEYDLFFYASGEELLTHMPRDVQVLFLDIAMGGLSGMEAARQLREQGVECAIFFITSMTQYAVEGYGVHAYAFLEKPVVYAQLRRQLLECFSRMDARRPAVLVVDTARGKEVLPMADILYAEVYQHETSFTLPDRKVTAAIQLSQAEKQMTPHGFYRCHRSYLVGFSHISRIDADALTMSDGAAIPMSKYRRKNFLDAYANYMGVCL